MPYPKAFPGNILRVSPDLLPAGSVCIEECWIDGRKHDDFDAMGLKVFLPTSETRQKVKVKLSPTNWLQGQEGK
jgi:hypothetical protein